MPNINVVHLAGHLGRDAETRQAGASTVLSFSVATSRKWKKGDSWEEETTWTNIVQWNPPDWMAGALVKGAAVMVTGRLSCRSYEKEGRKVFVTEVVADRVWPLGAKGRPDDRPVSAARPRAVDSPAQMTSPEGPGITDDDVPF